MRKITLAAVSLVVAAGFASAAVEMKPIHVNEQRSVELVKDDIGRGGDSLQIVFSLSGPEAATAIQYGELKLDEAVDDKGTNLIPAEDPFNEAAKFKEFANEFYRKHDKEQNRPVAAPQIGINLAPAKRAATKIARLRGSISIIDQGTIKTVEITGLKPGDKKKLDVPANAGVTLTTNIKQDDLTNIELEVSGNNDAIDSLEVYDAAGEQISNGGGHWSVDDGPIHRTISLSKPLDASMKLVAKISVDRKTTKIPFDLKDIALP